MSLGRTAAMVGMLALGALVLAGSTGAQPAAPKAPPAASSSPNGKNAPVTVNSDTLESLQKEGLAVFKGNVVARQDNSTQYADRMEVYTDAKTRSIERVVSTGNVRIITRDCRMGTANRAEYYDAEQRVVLIGNARVWREDNIVTGERITIYLAEDRSVVEGGKQERVKAIFYPSAQDRPKADMKAGPGGPVCP
ncbi:MAG TPA: lipopolysaccharide transport periplasmic protein LptA [Methylomirabilota bacterium]|jgi:lipopolysaccharide export system protein LptA|nr:lipopolysaccharide transport periplasmic protein LptA [Methylomirabilota bacterium]